MFHSSDFTHRLAAVLVFAASILWSEALGLSMEKNCSLCQVPKHYGHEETLEKLKPLCGHRFLAIDPSGEFQYNVGICATGEIAEMDVDLKTAGAVQTDLKNQERKVKTMIGNLEKTEVMSGKNWISLEYEGGNSYGHYCTSEARRTIVMIICVPGETKGNFRWMEENRNKTEDCYYLFELEHEAACNDNLSDDDSGLSPGSIVCIILGSIVAAYLIFGILFMRFGRGAKGIHQIPNYEFWRDFGNLQADGCDLICRCSKNRYTNEKPNYGIGDHQIESANDGDDLDEHLLPM